MSDILFGQSYYLRFDPKLWKAMQPYPPLGTLYAASYLRDLGFDVALFDAMLAESEDEWETALDLQKPRIAVIYEDNFNYLSKMCLLRMRWAAFNMIESAKQHNCIVIVSGSDASDHPQIYLQQGADFVIIGEGEHTLGELIQQLSSHRPPTFESILGLAYLDPLKDNLLRITPRRPDIRHLDALPFPAWDLIDVERYRQIWKSKHGYFSMNVATTRGCPYHCNWCAKPIWGQRYNVRSPENVISEIKWIKEEFQPDHLWFVDDIFGLKPGWLTQFADLMIENDISIPYKSLNRVDLLLRQGEIEALKRSGCAIVWVGAESGSQKILDAMEKGTTVEQIYEVSNRLHQAGIQVGFFLQFGYPGETKEDIAATFQMVRDCRPDDIGMSVSYPLPGTKFYQSVRQQLGEKHNWEDSDDLAMLYRGPFPTDFYRKLHVVLHKEFRSQRTWRYLFNRSTRWSPQGFLNNTTKDLTKKITRLIYDISTLLLDRYKLRKLARLPHQGLDVRTQRLSPEDAAKPSPPQD